MRLRRFALLFFVEPLQHAIEVLNAAPHGQRMACAGKREIDDGIAPTAVEQSEQRLVDFPVRVFQGCFIRNEKPDGLGSLLPTLAAIEHHGDQGVDPAIRFVDGVGPLRHRLGRWPQFALPVGRQLQEQFGRPRWIDPLDCLEELPGVWALAPMQPGLQRRHVAGLVDLLQPRHGPLPSGQGRLCPRLELASVVGCGELMQRKDGDRAKLFAGRFGACSICARLEFVAKGGRLRRLTPVFLDQQVQHVFTRIALARILSSGRSFRRACDLPTGLPGRLAAVN